MNEEIQRKKMNITGRGKDAKKNNRGENIKKKNEKWGTGETDIEKEINKYESTCPYLCCPIPTELSWMFL
jgi:hypothetical protein